MAYTKEQLGREFGRVILEADWAYFKEMGLVDQLSSNEPEDRLEARKLIQRYYDNCDQRAIEQRQRRSEGIGPMQADRCSTERSRVIAKVKANDASSDGSLRRFRKEMLQNTLIEPSQVGTWISARIDEGPPPKQVRWIEAQLPPDNALTVQNSKFCLAHPLHPAPGAFRVRSKTHWVRYYNPVSDCVERAAIPASGALFRLAALAKQLADRYGWMEGEATTFVLTDLAPGHHPIRVSRRFSEVHPTASTITLTIDPATPAHEVREVYSWLRSPIAAKGRAPGAKSIRIAGFMLDRPEGDTWKSHWKAWNNANPTERYSDPWAFRKAALRARKLIIEPSYRPT